MAGQNHYIVANMYLSDRENLIASGTVTVNDCIRFNLAVKNGTGKDGETKDFISYPYRVTGKEEEPFQTVCYPKEQALRDAIEQEVMRQVNMLRQMPARAPEVTSVRVTPLTGNDSKTKGVGNVTIAGMAISGIMIQEGKSGLYVRMPQYTDKDGKSHDLVYGINARVKEAISNACLEEYSRITAPSYERTPSQERALH